MAGKPKPEVYTAERCYITEVLNKQAWPEVSLARARVLPGVTTQLHMLSVAEWYIIESGSGRVWVGDAEPWAVEAGAVVTIPSGVAQRIENTGRDDLIFLCLCAPRFLQDCYTPLE
jgi:mannose-6-phosphate isomerase-like protein (cupin superfamily)